MIKIYTLSHKDFEPPKDPIYVPLSVFCDKGNNIADKNCYYSELTGCYWVYKNSTADIVGVCHYRRYLINEKGSLFSEKEIEDILLSHDLITTKVLSLNFPYQYGFSKNHKPYYLEELDKLLQEKYPEEYAVYKELVTGVHTLFGNMLIAKKALFDEYHKWLFDILFELEKRIVIDEPDSYHRRIFGFISEFLLYVFIKLRGLNVYHAMVGMIGEKTEVRSIKENIAKYFMASDYLGAKKYFLEEYEKRPDILMEASDIGFELHMCMEAISICEYEADDGEEIFLHRIKDFNEIMSFLKKLNQYARSGEFPEEFIKKYKVSQHAINISLKLANASKFDKI